MSDAKIYFAGKLEPAHVKRRTLFHHIFLAFEAANRETLEQWGWGRQLADAMDR
jgi:hypothetical protein